jgi:catechol 2,3-dioxygenase-like lactoylglutathione lyase family enzyme
MAAVAPQPVATSPVPARQLQGITPVLAVSDVVKLANFYRDVLGFGYDRFWGDPPCFVMLTRDGVDLFLSGSPDTHRVAPNQKQLGGAPWDAYIWVEDAARLLEECRTRGAKIASGPEATFYKTIEFVVEDPDGHRLCFAQDTSRAKMSLMP